MSEGTVMNNHFFSRSGLNIVNHRLYSHTIVFLVAHIGKCESRYRYRLTIGGDIEQVLGFVHLCRVLNEYRWVTEVLFLFTIYLLARATTYEFYRFNILSLIGIVHKE